ncbi:MAG: hydrogenase/sulfur reductase subunit alpha [Elusimicrobia bacterium GWF2_52_66]|nr:MAG: hydrogenase/sulfur reductase subunit alpha [Elusimicrobia bacterium GWA2_51_34]OGR85609.1 MAG: hydrogenase/sulfur reductase subunit alpha [Elusimicrobia bacterium GWF2_52_66]HAF96608.1 Ni/Fe hydrogenase subunit alpha [Elusimicrobiota bacterium]HCE98166.1 Ni/Fe hydrogenase subunit alpha [Elusimicrobiota bacterium]
MATENKNLDIKVEYLTRVEGHGNIVVNVKNGKIEKCEFHVVESPRLFEGMLRGRSIFEAQHITSRICGICSCGHTLASIQAAEDALGVVPTSQTIKLRKLLLDYEFLDSHILHFYLLAAPDILGAPSFVPLIETHNAMVRRALRMKKAANDVCDILVGRHVHPISAIVGGFTKLPRPKDLAAMLNILEGMQKDMADTLKLAASLKFPDFHRETEYVALVSDDGEYPLLAGDIGSTDGKRFKKTDYKKATNEFIDPRSSAKFTKLSRDSFFVGALARFNLNYDKLHPEAKKAAESLGFKPVCHNPYLNTVAQVVEIVHCWHNAVELIKDLQKNGLDYGEEITVGLNEKGAVPVRAGNGVGAVEVPRGILYHNYDIDKAGIIKQADCIIPTNQNINNIEYDFQKLLPEILTLPEDTIRLRLEMLVRAYDPCISCSAHYLDVKFVE